MSQPRSALTPRNLRSGANPSNCRISWNPCSIASKLRIALDGQKRNHFRYVHKKYLHPFTFKKKQKHKKHPISSNQNLLGQKHVWQHLDELVDSTRTEVCRVSMVEVTKAAPSMWGKRLQTQGTFSQSLMWKVSPTKVTINANLGFENFNTSFTNVTHITQFCRVTVTSPRRCKQKSWHLIGAYCKEGGSRESRERKQSRAGFSERFPIACRNEYRFV